jgi:DNA invertase Pin-like site-specific DNA recombinase
MDRAPRNVRRRGLSGGTIEHPALQRLLSNIKAGKVQIVVYKVDRLTRSLADFAKIVDVLDAHDASFVSVTQQFNTTTAMGVTLKMLLSFAQFEREIAGERIRDKIAASKRKGMWMGGNVPLGYDVRERKLVVSEAEASTVRMIFQRYAELGSVALLKAELERAGIVSKRREGADGELSGGKRFSRGALYLMLQNWLYRATSRTRSSIATALVYLPRMPMPKLRQKSRSFSDRFPRPPFSGSGYMIARAMAFCHLERSLRAILVDTMNAFGSAPWFSLI